VRNRAGRSAQFERPATLICSTRGAMRPRVDEFRRADELCADEGDDFRVTPWRIGRRPALTAELLPARGVARFARGSIAPAGR
jgi:hypothetical protein